MLTNNLDSVIINPHKVDLGENNMSQATLISNSNVVGSAAGAVVVDAKRVSKKEKAKELYVKYSTLSRNEIIQKFIDELDMPENSARTYVSTCAKELNNRLGKQYKTRNVNKSNLKREKALTIYANNSHLDRKEIIEKLKTELDMTHNSAATHCSIAAKLYKNK